MPVILPKEKRAAWLEQGRDVEELKSFLVPFDAAKMAAYPISARVGSPKFDDPGIIEPLPTQAPLF